MQSIPFLSSGPFIHLETIINHTSFFKVLFYHFIIVLLEIPLSFLVWAHISRDPISFCTADMLRRTAGEC